MDQSQKIAQRLAILACLMAILAIALGVQVVLGYQLGVAGLIRFFGHSTPMAYSAAICFILSGMAVLAAVAGCGRWTAALGSVVGVVGVAALMTHGLGTAPLIDQFLVSTLVSHLAVDFTSIAPNTAFCFILVGVGLYCMGSSQPRVWIPAVPGIAGAMMIGVGVVTLFGYTTGIELAEIWGAAAKMALQTSLGMIVVGAGMMAMACRRSLSEAADPPHWLPLTAGVGVLTVTLLLWQTLAGHENQDMQGRIPDVSWEGVSFATISMGMVLAVLLTWALHLLLVERRNSREIRRSNKILKELELSLDTASAITTTDLQGMILSANDNFCKLSGFTREELLGKNHRIVESGYHPKAFFAGLWNTVLAGRVWKGEVRNKKKNGSFYWCFTTIIPFLDELGKPVQFMAIRHDITDRKRMEAELKESRERYVLAIQGSYDGIWDWEVESGKMYFSPRFKNVLGYDDADVEDTFDALRGLIHPDDLERMTVELESYVGGKSHRFEIELRMRQKDGQYRWMLLRGAAFRDSYSKVYRMAGSQTDITDRKKSERELARRTQELARSNHALEEFAHVAAHELNTPVSVIIAAANNLRDGMLGAVSAEQVHAVDVVARSANQMSRTIVNLLNLARLRVKERSVDRYQTDVLHVIYETIQDLRLVITERKLELKTDLPEKLPEVDLDHHMLVQILHNVVGNAIRFAQKEVVVNTAVAEDGDVLVTVADDGPGISEEHLSHLFERFVQVHARDEKDRAYQGTGLGLAICKEILERHGGKMWVESALGKGTRVYFKVPANPASSLDN